MDPEIRRELEETRELTRENNRILRSMRRTQWIGFLIKLVGWAIILALPIYLYQQYVAPLSLPSSEEIQQVFQQYKPK